MTFVQLSALILVMMTTATVGIVYKARHRGDSEAILNQTRILSWWVICSACLLIVFLGGWPLWLALTIAAFAAALELLRLIQVKHIPAYWSGAVITVIVFTLAWTSPALLNKWSYLLTVFCAIFSILIPMQNALKTALEILTVVGGLMSVAILYAHTAALNLDSRTLILLLFFMTAINDIAQYYCGKALGQHQLTPTISPNKTIEGAVGGICVTALIGAIILPLVLPLPWYLGALIGILTGVAGITGDLFISQLKRHAGVKDSGQLIPGHGGALDRIDSLLLTAPVFGFSIFTTLNWIT